LNREPRKLKEGALQYYSMFDLNNFRRYITQFGNMFFGITKRVIDSILMS
jgi:hypothetical protein